MAYFAKSGHFDLINCSQREQYIQLVMGMTEEEVQCRISQTIETVESLLRNVFQLQIEKRLLSASELKLSERSGLVLENGILFHCSLGL